MLFFEYITAMKKTAALITYAAALLLSPHAAMAQKQPATDAVACYSISSPDARAYCLARVHRDPGRCYNVQYLELRAICLAEVRR